MLRNLGQHIREKQVASMLESCGRIVSIQFPGRRVSIVQFEDEAAIGKALRFNNTRQPLLKTSKLIVELSNEEVNKRPRLQLGSFVERPAPHFNNPLIPSLPLVIREALNKLYRKQLVNYVSCLQFIPQGNKMDPEIGMTPERPARLYADGVFDMFHFGHARLFRQCKQKFPYVYLIVGVSGDEETNRLKGKTVMNAAERAESIEHCKWVDEVIQPCPWILTLEFLQENNIDFVCHDEIPYTSDGQEDIYTTIKKAGKFLATQRTEAISTSDLILRIVKDYDEYVRRNLARGYNRKDLNVGFMHSTNIRMRSGLDSLRKKWKQLKDRIRNRDQQDDHHLEQSVDKFRDHLWVFIQGWGDKSDHFISRFLKKFGEGMETVEDLMKRAFRFESLRSPSSESN